jgi:uncharacterized membrane protein HdeD (DUF308 family)/3',5'-cyclic AMP phosphodiesterase CpdA
VALLALGVGGLVAPLGAGRWVLGLLGIGLAAAGAVQLVQAWSLGARPAGRTAYLSGILTTLAGVLLLLSPVLVLSGLVTLVALVLLADGAGRLLAALREGDGGARVWTAAGGLVSLGLAALVWTQRGWIGPGTLGAVVGLYLLSQGWAVLLAPAGGAGPDADAPEPDRHPVAALGLPPHPELGRLHAAAVARERAGARRDRYWIGTLVLVFLAIHLGRMSASLTWLGLVSPAVAVAGDLLVALLLALGLVWPVQAAWRRLTRPLERLAWRRRLAGDSARAGLAGPVAHAWLDARLGRAVRLREARGSLGAALRMALGAGLPLTAVLVATNPIWGFSWYFNTENWAGGVWQRVAETRVDRWRGAMVEAVRAARPAAAGDPWALFDVHPEGVDGPGDFAFLVIGDPGEGDPSQAALRDRYLELGRRPDVRFLVVSSDVIYPSGEMKDYEFNFHLPFKGFAKPIYAIPGNHDWFNALNGFLANFLEPEAARAAIRARAVHDLGYGASEEGYVDRLVEAGVRLRRAYGVRTGEQRAPYFAVRTDGFTLLAADTGILRRLDPVQEAWLDAALAGARGTFTMVLLGHPLYAGGVYQGAADPAFARIHERLRAHGVPLVMAGDTHDLEYYREPYAGRAGPATMHHVVNGGGGAYLSIGTALDWPARPPVADWAFYPRPDAVRRKLDAETPGWKRPVWWWVTRLGAWPASVEALSAVFDFNRAPFFQSFVEVRVERSRRRVRLVLHGPDGPLRWRDLAVGGAAVPPGQGPDDAAEIVVPAAPAPA